MTHYLFRTHLPKLLTLAALLIVPSACLLQAASVTPAGTTPLPEPDTKHVAAQTTPQAPTNAAQDLLRKAALRMNASDASEHFQKAIAAGADVSKKIVFGIFSEECWALQSTIFCGNIKCVPLLLDAGAPVAVPDTNNSDPLRLSGSFWQKTPLELAATAYDQAYRRTINREICFSVALTEESAARKLRQAKTLFKMILHAHAPTSAEVASFPWQNFDSSLRDLTLEVAQERMQERQNVSAQRDAQAKALLVGQSHAFQGLYDTIIQGYARQRFVEYLEDQEKQNPSIASKK